MTSNDKKLILHIGTGKAGSTSIQESLRVFGKASTDVKALHSFGFPNAKLLAMATQSKHSHSYFVKRRKVISEAGFKKNSQKIWKNTQLEVSNSKENVFLASSEFIGAMVRGEHIATLSEELRKIFNDIMIVIYLRDQRSFLRSLWAQSVKGPSKSTESFHEFMCNLDKSSYLWNYSLFLKDWLDIFGANLNVSIFDEKTLFCGDVVKDFYNKAGIKNLTISNSGRRNVSPSFKELEKIRLENLSIKKPSQTNRKQQNVKELSDSEYEALILNKVSGGNKWVNKAFFENSPLKLPT